VDNKLKVTILTKSGLWGLVRDRDIFTLHHDSTSCSDSLARQGYPQAHTWAATLTLDDPAMSQQWEPHAALPEERIMGLRQAKAWGFDTWVSFEPVIDPEAVYRLLDETHEFTDHYKVGKLNYHPHARTIDWRRFKNEIEERLVKLGKPYYLKQDLLEAAA
jgi:DNA repair photolyase